LIAIAFGVSDDNEIPGRAVRLSPESLRVDVCQPAITAVVASTVAGSPALSTPSPINFHFSLILAELG
jgi:hypothetical protein